MKYDNLRFTRLEVSAGWDYKEIRTALRDIPESAMNVTADDGQITASFDGGNEVLQSFELLCNDRELFAVDNDPAIDPAKYETILVKFGARNMRRYIQRNVEDAIAEAVIADYTHSLSQILVHVKDGELKVTCM